MQNAPMEHYAGNKVPHGFKTFVLSIFEWLFKTGFTVVFCLSVNFCGSAVAQW